jgi:hypothetical protein
MNYPDDIAYENNQSGNSPFAVMSKCTNCGADIENNIWINESGYCSDCEVLILEGKL